MFIPQNNPSKELTINNQQLTAFTHKPYHCNNILKNHSEERRHLLFMVRTAMHSPPHSLFNV